METQIGQVFQSGPYKGFITTTANNKVLAVVNGKSKHSLHLKQELPTVRDAFNTLTQWQKDYEAKRAKRSQSMSQARTGRKQEFLKKLQPGLIFDASWGYEQTNREFWVIDSIVGSRITITKLGHIQVESFGWASEKVIPDKSKRLMTITKTIVSDHIKIGSFVLYSIWDGKPSYSSSYA